MKHPRSHKTNCRIIAGMVSVFFAVMAMLCLAGCNTGKKTVERSKKLEENSLSSDTNTTTRTTGFDRSIINTQDWQLDYEPIDPSKEMSITTDGNTTTYNNARPSWSNKTTKEDRNTGHQIDQEQNKKVDETSKKVDDNKTSTKIWARVPFTLILGGLAFLYFVYRDWRSRKTTGMLTGAISELQKKINNEPGS